MPNHTDTMSRQTEEGPKTENAKTKERRETRGDNEQQPPQPEAGVRTYTMDNPHTQKRERGRKDRTTHNRERERER